MHSRKKGFTLIELLIVVAIIGVLSAVVLVSLNSARAKGRDAKRMSDMRQMQNAIELYMADNGGSAPEVGAVIDRSPISWGSLPAELVPDYIPELPKDPCGISCGSHFIYGYSSPSSNNSSSFAEYGDTYGLEAKFEVTGGNFIIGNTDGLFGSASF